MNEQNYCKSKLFHKIKRIGFFSKSKIINELLIQALIQKKDFRIRSYNFIKI